MANFRLLQTEKDCTVVEKGEITPLPTVCSNAFAAET